MLRMADDSMTIDLGSVSGCRFVDGDQAGYLMFEGRVSGRTLVHLQPLAGYSDVADIVCGSTV